MSLTKPKQTLIGICCAAVLLDLSESTVLKGLCGTENLTQIRRGRGKRQRVSLILEEVVALRADWIEAELKKKLKISDKKPRLTLAT